jgi:hypothetical protein
MTILETLKIVGLSIFLAIFVFMLPIYLIAHLFIVKLENVLLGVIVELVYIIISLTSLIYILSNYF